MKYLKGDEAQEGIRYIQKAAILALNSNCFRARCGSVIVKNHLIIGRGYNSPPMGEVLTACRKDTLPSQFKSDRTCCIHAEQRAIMDALKKHPDKIKGSRLYFIRIDHNNHLQKAGKPYCTICSKMALDAGITEFSLWNTKGVCVYNTKEYNDTSFAYKGD